MNRPSMTHLMRLTMALTVVGSVAGCFRSTLPVVAQARAGNVQARQANDSAVKLGRKLFFDPKLSRTGRVACATCHVPARNFAGVFPVSTGVEGRKGTRNSPTVLGADHAPLLFWDGRTRGLEAQVLGPLTNPVEMDADPAVVVQMLNADPTYAAMFRAAYNEAASEARLTQAIASYERALVPGENAYDRWNDGDDNAMSPAAVRGQAIFSRNHCGECHKTTNMTDHQFYNLGVGLDKPNPDPGRAAITHDAADFGKFKTPTLRNIAESAPYFHDGSAATLEAVVDFYNDGGIPNPNLDHRIKPLGLDAGQKADLVAFMRALSGGHNDASLKPKPNQR